MIGDKRLLAVIPARGGSKRLPRKNILDLAGKPLIAWTIEAALGSKYIDRVVVSTDDGEIADISKQFGADVPFIRPIELASDEATSIDVVLHSLKELEMQKDHYDFIVLLQPTSPLRTTEHIDKAIEQLIERDDDAVISVCKAEHHPLWCNELGDDKDMSGFLREEIVNKRSQELPDYYRLNGAIYLCDVERLKSKMTFFLNEKISAYIMKQDVSVDIDMRSDLDLAILEMEE